MKLMARREPTIPKEFTFNFRREEGSILSDLQKLGNK